MEQATKKKLLIGLAATAAVVLLAALIWLIIFNSQFRVYADRVDRFSIRYPSAWQMVPHPQAGASVVFVSPKETALDTFRENVNISIQDLPMEISSIKGLTDTILLQMTKVFPNIKVAQSLPVEFGGHKGNRVLFVADQPEKVRILTVWTVKGASKAYILTYMATGKAYPTYLPLVEEMIKSFRLN